MSAQFEKVYPQRGQPNQVNPVNGENGQNGQNGQRPSVAILPAGAPQIVSQSESAWRTNGQRQGRRIACRECRQGKLKCLREDGESCSRCSRMGLGCSIDRKYRRVNKRMQIKELIDKLDHFRQNANGSGPDLGGSQQDSPSPTNVSQGVYLGLDSMRRQSDVGIEQQHEFPHNITHQVTNHIQDGQNTHPPPSQVQPASQVEFPRPLWTCASRSIENVCLSGQQIHELFQQFFEHYHHMLEILDASIQPDLYFTRSPLLFWSIISIACRHYEEDSTLLPSLEPCVSKLLWRTLGVLPHSGFTVQALLLLSLWPSPASSMSNDTSFLFASIAKTSAMQLGLHRPDTVQDFLRVKTQLGPAAFLDAVRTYIGCYICAESHTSNLGQPSIFQDDPAIGYTWDLGQNFTISDNLRLHHLIVGLMGRVNRVLADNLRSSQPTESLLRLLESDLDEIKKRNSERFNTFHHINVKAAYLQLYIYYFFFDTGSNVRKEGLLKCYNTSLDLITMTSEEDKQSAFAIHCPNYHCQALTSAALVVLKILHSSYGKCLHSDRGKRAFNTVLSLLRRSSLQNNDLWGRGSMILTQLWGLYQRKPEKRDQEPTLRVKTRYAASVLHDSLWTWREEFGSQGHVVPQTTVSLSPPSEIEPTPYPDSLGNEMSAPGEFNNANQPTGYGTEPHSGVENSADIRGASLGPEAIPDADWMWNIGFPTLPTDYHLYMDAAPANVY